MAERRTGCGGSRHLAGRVERRRWQEELPQEEGEEQGGNGEEGECHEGQDGDKPTDVFTDERADAQANGQADDIWEQ